MGEIADMMIDGTLDMYTGEYIGRGPGYPRTLDRSLPWERNHNPRKGVLTYIHRLYVGKAQMPKAISIAEHYAKEKDFKYSSKEEMFNQISAKFSDFKTWLNKNTDEMYKLYH